MSGARRLINSMNTIQGGSVADLQVKLNTDVNSQAASINCIPCKKEYPVKNTAILRNTKGGK